MRTLKGEDWFNLGDKDLALHVLRTHALKQDVSLTTITASVARRFGITAQVLPMTDDPVRTMLETDEGTLEFQRYFVERRAEPVVSGIRYMNAEIARPNQQVLAALRDPLLEAVVICPSNPWLSVAPLLAMPDLYQALRRTRAPVVAVSPIVAGKAIKGPTAKLMRELNLPVDAVSVARYYGDMLDGFVLDDTDRTLCAEVEDLGFAATTAQTVMIDDTAKRDLAIEVLAFAQSLRNPRQ